MTLFRPGLACPICKVAIERGQAKVGFPAFIRNLKDPLLVFNDATVHTACWEAHPLKARMLRRLTENESFRTRIHACAACGEVIDDLSQMYTAGHLTDDESHPAFEFNGVTLHEQHLSSWGRYSTFERVIRSFQISEGWQSAEPILQGSPYNAIVQRGRLYPLSR